MELNTPLRKVGHESDLNLTDEDLAQIEALRKEAAAFLSKETEQPLVPGVLPELETFSLDDLTANRSFPENFSLSTFGDYVCNIVNTSIVGAAHGKIENLLLAIPPNLDRNGRIITNPAVDAMDERHQKTLISLLDSHTSLTIVCHSHQVATVQQWLQDLGVPQSRVKLCISVFKYSIWAQDAYVALSDATGGQVLCEGVNFPRYDDMSIADDVSAQTSVSALQSYLYFQGGNVLGTKDAVLIGSDYVMKNHGRAHLETQQKVIALMTKLFGRQTLSIGRSTPIPRTDRQYLSGTYQPIFHIDMYITPTGVIDSKGKEIVLVGRPAKARSILNQPAEPYDVDQYFEEAENQLSQFFTPVQLPLYATQANGRYYHLSYNNAVLENYQDGQGNVKRVVYMPTFEQDAAAIGVDPQIRSDLDAAAEQTWQGVGFEVRRMDGLEDLAYGWGSVHCITKALKRTGYQP